MRRRNEEEEFYDDYPDDARPNRRPLIIVLIVVGVLLLIAGIITVIYRTAYNPEETVIEFCDEFNAGEYRRALRYVDPSETKAITSLMDIAGDKVSKQVIKLAEHFLPFLSDMTNAKLYPEIIDTSVNGRNAVVTIQLENVSGYYDVHLKRRALKWYIHHVSVSDKKAPEVSVPDEAETA